MVALELDLAVVDAELELDNVANLGASLKASSTLRL